MHLVGVAAAQFRFRARRPMRLPGYMGSAWRGGFGRALRRAACITGLPTCPGCPFEARCIYPDIFETPGDLGVGILADYERVPNPYVLAPSWDDARALDAGAETALRLVLIGRAAEHFALARQALAEAGLHGIGPDRGPLDLVAVEPMRAALPAPRPQRVAIELLSPLRLVEEGRPVGPDAFRPRHLLVSLLRRVSLLAERHDGAGLALDYRALKDQAQTADFAEKAVRWAEWRRWSGRQQRLIPMGGLLGRLALPLAGLEEFWPFLSLGPLVHTGKGTTMGLGAMRVTPQ